MLRVLLAILFITPLLSSCLVPTTPTTPTAKSISEHLYYRDPRITSFDYWNLVEQVNIVYATSFPLYVTTHFINRKLHYFMLVYDKVENKYFINIVGGKNYKEASEVIIRFSDCSTYRLPTYKDRAWLINQEVVKDFIYDMKKNTHFLVMSYFEDKTKAFDSYSLKGFLDTYYSMDPYNDL